MSIYMNFMTFDIWRRLILKLWKILHVTTFYSSTSPRHCLHRHVRRIYLVLVWGLEEIAHLEWVLAESLIGLFFIAIWQCSYITVVGRCRAILHNILIRSLNISPTQNGITFGPILRSVFQMAIVSIIRHHVIAYLVIDLCLSYYSIVGPMKLFQISVTPFIRRFIDRFFLIKYKLLLEICLFKIVIHRILAYLLSISCLTLISIMKVFAYILFDIIIIIDICGSHAMFISHRYDLSLFLFVLSFCVNWTHLVILFKIYFIVELL